MKQKIVATIKQKGWLGKTTTSVNPARCLAITKDRVLLIDPVPQAHATIGLSILIII